MSLKSVEDLMNSDKNGTKFKSKLIGKRRYIEIKPSALNLYKSDTNQDYDNLSKENGDLKIEIKNKEFQVGELISIVRQQTLALPKPKKTFLERIGFRKKQD
jgi:translation initiation factor RLI1